MDEPFFNGPLARLARSAFAAGCPDPWSAEIDLAVRDPSAIPLCVGCLLPQAPHQWFCPRCGFPTNDFVPTMPYLQVFVVAEVLRRGVTGAPEPRVGPQLFLVVFSLTQYAVFAPVYWYWMIRRAQRRPIRHELEIEFEETG